MKKTCKTCNKAFTRQCLGIAADCLGLDEPFKHKHYSPKYVDIRLFRATVNVLIMSIIPLSLDVAKKQRVRFDRIMERMGA